MKTAFECFRDCFRVEEAKPLSVSMVARSGSLGYKLPKEVSGW